MDFVYLAFLIEKGSNMYIGGIKIDNPFLSAPLAGVTDSAMRRINRDFGSSMVFSEMISGKGLIYNNKGTEELLSFAAEEEPIAYQIFGCDPEIMGKTAAILSERKNKIIDINMGCPVPKVVKNGEGSAMLRDPKTVYEVVKSVVENANKPVSVKIRLGWDDDSKNYIEIAKTIEKAGASAITVHGRTRAQYYSGKADWQAIKEVREAVKIDVIGNGDIFCGEDAMAMMEKTGCQLVMIGRGMLGNPWIFQDCNRLYKGDIYNKNIAFSEKADTIKKHLQLLVEIKGEERGVKEMRKHIAWYTKGMANSSFFRNQLNQIASFEEALEKIDEFAYFIERK